MAAPTLEARAHSGPRTPLSWTQLAEVALTLSQDHALVLHEWLERAGSNEDGWIDQAEQRAVWDLAATLETLLQVFAADYRELARSERDRVRDAAD